jgi:hypothetical protein
VLASRSVPDVESVERKIKRILITNQKCYIVEENRWYNPKKEGEHVTIFLIPPTTTFSMATRIQCRYGIIMGHRDLFPTHPTVQ